MRQRARIVCTLGPASDSDAMVRAMIRVGMDVARLNFSHGDHPTHAARIERVRRIAKEEKTTVAILADLQGPKIRVGNIAAGAIQLDAGKAFTLTTRKINGDTNAVSVDISELAPAVTEGQHILLDDGLIELEVVSKNENDVITRVITGGLLKPHKGVNLPNVALGISAITDKDRNDLAFAADHDVDYIALSFVRHAKDVQELKQLLAARSNPIPVIAKIEKPEAVHAIDAIIQASDGIMVARGDLGVEALPEQVPIFQKTIIHKANAVGKPVITATQMLESMINNPRPTRAEASDVANAIFDGTDAVMLSAETAVGKYPVEAVRTMERIANAAAESAQFKSQTFSWNDDPMTVTNAIGAATCQIARQLNARVIITATSSGHTARMVARHRPQVPIFAVTNSDKTQRRLALVWGIESALVQDTTSTDVMITQSIAAAVDAGAIQCGDVVVITAGAPAGISGKTNMIQVRVAE